MIFKYSQNIANNPNNLLGPQHDNYVSCFGEKFLSTLQLRQLANFTYYDNDSDQKFNILITDYFLQPITQKYTGTGLTLPDNFDYLHLYELFVKIQVRSNSTNFLEKWVCIGCIPKMQERGGFIRNQIRRVILHQIIRSPGLYTGVNFTADPTSFEALHDPILKHRRAHARVIPEYGTWLKIEASISGPRQHILSHNLDSFGTLDKIRWTTESFSKAPFVLLLTGLGIAPTSLLDFCSIGAQNNPDHLKIWYDEIQDSELDSLPNPWSRQQALWLLWSKIKPFKRRRIPRTPEAVEALLVESFCNSATYNLGEIGHKQFCQELGITENLKSDHYPLTIPKLCLVANHLITLRHDTDIKPQSGSSNYTKTNAESLNNRKMRTPGELLLNCIISELANLEKIDQRFRTRGLGNLKKLQNLKETNLGFQWETVNQFQYDKFINAKNLINPDSLLIDKENSDEIEHLNKLRLMPEYDLLIKEEVLKRFVFLLQEVLEQSTKTFLNAIQISQLEDTLNPISDLTLKRRVSILGPDGITRDQASITMRNIHPTTYGRLCPIETPEGQNAGLVRSLAMHAFVPDTGQIEAPFIDLNTVTNQSFIKYIDSVTDSSFLFGLPDVMVAEKNPSLSSAILTKQDLFFNRAPLWDCSFFGLSATQLLSVGTTLTPFLEHNDATRVLMGSNMQRQSLSLINCERPIVGTGSEILIGVDSRYIKRAPISGIICGTNLHSVYLLDIHYNDFLANFKFAPSLFSFFNSYNLNKHANTLFQIAPFSNLSGKVIKKTLIGPKKSNKSTISRYLPSNILHIGDWVAKGTSIAAETGLENGQLALGLNLQVAYMPWDGFNFEDAIAFNQRTALSERVKTFHIKRFDIMITKKQKVTGDFTDVPGVIASTHQHLDKSGFVLPGSFVRQGDALVGIVGKNPSPRLWKVRLMKKLMKIDPAISSINYELMEQSFFVPLGLGGRVIAVQKRKNSEGLSIRIYLLLIRFLQIGDKLSGRHGNKGVISCLVPAQDMPYKASGEQVDLILNPLGVPSRMNLGQIFECLLGLAGQQLQQRYKVLAFDEIFAFNASKRLCYTKLYEAQKLLNNVDIFNLEYPGKAWMIDGRNGMSFEQPVVFGISYILKLCHQVEEKLHGRATGQYSLITQQPVQGRARGGGQRVGEMEVWAFEGFGASFILQELLSIKSDDTTGRKEVAKALLRGKPVYTNDIQSYSKPQTLQTVSYELKALCLDFRLSEV